MKYMIMIHSNPQPWGHPTSDFLPEYAALSEQERAEGNAAFEALCAELSERGEWVTASPLGDPAAARLYRKAGGTTTVTQGPYSETNEHLAGFFVIDVASQERAFEIGDRFASVGETIELRPMF